MSLDKKARLAVEGKPVIRNYPITSLKLWYPLAKGK